MERQTIRLMRQSISVYFPGFTSVGRINWRQWGHSAHAWARFAFQLFLQYGHCNKTDSPPATEKTCLLNAKTTEPKARKNTLIAVMYTSLNVTPGMRLNCSVQRYDPKADNTLSEVETLGHAFHNTANSAINPIKKRAKPKA